MSRFLKTIRFGLLAISLAIVLHDANSSNITSRSQGYNTAGNTSLIRNRRAQDANDPFYFYDIYGDEDDDDDDDDYYYYGDDDDDEYNNYYYHRARRSVNETSQEVDERQSDGVVAAKESITKGGLMELLLAGVNDKLTKCLKKFPPNKTVAILVDLLPNGGHYTVYSLNSFPALLSEYVSGLVLKLAADVPPSQIHVTLLNGTTLGDISVDGVRSTRPVYKMSPAGTEDVFMTPEIDPAGYLAERTRLAIEQHLLGQDTELPIRQIDREATLFTIVVTDGAQQTPLSFFPKPNAIFDLFGKYEQNEIPEAADENVIVGRPPQLIFPLMETARYLLCQHIHD